MKFGTSISILENFINFCFRILMGKNYIKIVPNLLGRRWYVGGTKRYVHLSVIKCERSILSRE
jgi:hypothetical protein